ncbi:hypothetical protein KHA93_01070 [Bacillus sp. FJAT-49732]|uniref:Uncharacterized protein n=1 Tax=Lederbergia citrisecunda TaxID=2833583 RepID=A0A942THN2_9BACI|nr:hypothetical protein [Lederbergia citrisecunda]MBS4198251.1 hypothetical protein [Lederbergia citrisecunda]
MKQIRKKILLGLGILVAAFTLFWVYDYLDNQRIEKQSDAFMKESRKLIEKYDIISVRVQAYEPQIKIYVSEKETKRNEINDTVIQIAEKLGMNDFEVVVKAVNEEHLVLD